MVNRNKGRAEREKKRSAIINKTNNKHARNMAHKRITKADLQRLEKIADKLYTLYLKYDGDEIPTKYGNGTQGELINTARAALDCIFQEYN